MRILPVVLGLLAFGCFFQEASAQTIQQTQHFWRRPVYQRDPCCDVPSWAPGTVMPIDPKDKLDPKDKVDPKDRKDPVVDPEVFRQAPSAGSSAGQSFNPGMFGDLGASGTTSVLVRRGSSSTPTAIRVPIVGRGAFKISDSESPRPTDRIFFNYNYYNRVNTPDTSFNLSRETIGFEKTFFDGDASFGMRFPFLQTSGDPGIRDFIDNGLGDMSVIFKYAFINNRETGDILSGGLTLTFPTSKNGIPMLDGTDMKTTLFQPYAGWILNQDGWYAQGFHGIVIPGDRRDVTILNNDVGFGYLYYTSPQRFVRALGPTLEGHVYTPLDHRSTTDQIQAVDIVTLTAGMNFVLQGGSVFGTAVAFPVTGPRPNNVEAIVTFNLRF